MKTTKTISPAYSVAGGDTVFEGFKFSGDNFLELQITFASLDETDHKIRIQESADGVNYTDSKDSSGNYIDIVLLSTLVSDIIKVNDFNAYYVRARFIEGTTGTGTISTLKFIME